ncbi:MAG TPA: carboxypeptidase regulatory-like domain-containing protein [Bryobacteraceae bacterium]|nr:carboxypeptidase regulatory-like domain-containing protein [Bryobacteraceae bacterium]
MFSRIVLLACALGSLAFAQEFRSTLTGRVTDPSGAAVPNANVAAIKTDTNSRFETKSNADGLYTLPLLPPGPYEISAEAPGFKSYAQSGINLSANQRVEVDVKLDLGKTSESVTVTADASQLETVTASSGQAITTREVENLPVNGRAPMDLAFLAFGVLTNGNRDQNRAFENAGFSNFAMGGAAVGANEALMDGVPNTGTLGTTKRRASFSAPVDAVSEVKVEAFNVDAAYGGAGGGTVNIITKSGTNQLHGALGEFNQTSALAATPFFTNKGGGKKTVSRQNQWSATVGGPVYIPKLYDGRNKLFFFFAYEGEKDSEPAPTFATTPTDAERNGDFSSLLALGSNYKIYDPNTGVLSGKNVVREPFPNNQIPKSRFNPVGVNLINLMGEPNHVGNADGTDNFFSPLVTGNNYHSYMARGDVNISDANKLTADMRTSLWRQDNGSVFHNISGGESAFRSLWGGMLDDVQTFSPTMVGNLRYGYNRYRAYYVQNSHGYDPTQLGFPSYIAANANALVIPQVSFSDGFATLGSGHFVDQPFDTHQLLGNLTKVAGQHTIKFGAEFRLYRFSNFNWSGATGKYSFDSTWVKASSTSGSVPVGGSIAALLLGLPTSGSYAINAASTYDSYYDVLFVQDDWHVKPNLTVNLGLRWEYNTPTTERWNRQSTGFDPTVKNQVTDAAIAAYAANPIPQVPVSQFQPYGGLTFATPDNRTGYATPTTSFSPRLGISWTPAILHHKTVIRAGMGIFDYNYGIIQGQQQGFSNTTSFVPTNDSYLTPATTLSNPFPDGIQQPPGASLGVNTYLGQSANYNNPDLSRMYSLRWNFDVQQQLSTDTVLELAYTGNHSVHLMTSYNFAALPAQYLSTSQVRDQATIDALGATVANPFAGLLPGTSRNGSTTKVSSLLAPFPEFSGVTESNMSNGGSYFHMFSAKLQKRFSHGFQFAVNFSHSRLIEKDSYLNSGSLALEKRVSSSDRPNSLSMMGTYSLPFGRGRSYLANPNPVVNAVLGNWQVAAIYSYASGAPLGWGNLIYYGGPLNFNSRNVDQAFDTTQFNSNSKEQLSQNLRYFPSQFNNLRVTGTNNLDLALSKRFPIKERMNMEFRADSFNVANRTQFSGPNLSVTSKAFGTITGATNTPRIFQLALRLTF